MKNLSILINNENVFEFERELSLVEEQLIFLDSMDSDMDKGIKVSGELLPNPNSQQRARFVAMNLIKGLQQENDAVITASCAYLINRFPLLIEVHANDREQAINIELVNEKPN